MLRFQAMRGRSAPTSFARVVIVALAGLAALPACRTTSRAAVPATPPLPLSDDPNVANLVDPFIGTDDGDSPDPPPGDKGGAVFPGATVPFGMIQWSPDTGPHAEFSYQHGDNKVKGFAVTHVSGPGCPSLLDFPFLPTLVTPTRTPSADRKPFWGEFRHDDEVATPGYYAVRFASGVTLRLTARTRAGFAQITYPAGAPAGLLVDAGKSVDDGETTVADGEIHVIGPNRISATVSSANFCGSKSNYRVHMVAEFDHAFVETSAYGRQSFHAGAREATGARSGLYLRFDTRESDTVGVSVAISYVSVANADANLRASSREAGFEAVRAEAARTWNQTLGRVQVRGGTDTERRVFYTALYHSLLHPNVFSDSNGEFIGFDNQVHVANGYTHYANESGWDIYRSWIQLAALVAPHETSDIVRSILVNGQQCGGLPRWTLANDETGVMVGDPSALVIANAYAFGVRGFDAKAALDLMRKDAGSAKTHCNRHDVRTGAKLYNDLGYLPADSPDAGWGPTSTTLEYAVADAAIARFAHALGDNDTAASFDARAGNWKKLWNPQSGYIHPRKKNGDWKTDFKPGSPDSYVEGNAAQYSFFVPQDMPGLFAMMGGNDHAIARLDQLFTQLNSGVSQPFFYIGNEPQFGTPWAYNRAGAPWKTQDIVRRIVTRAFSDKPGGLPGNDDLGAMSSWLVWAELGLYPDLPGVGGFAVGSPLYPHATIKLPGDKTLVIDAPGARADAPYVHGLSLDGKPWTAPWVPLDKLSGGATLSFVLGTGADQTWGTPARPTSAAKSNN